MNSTSEVELEHHGNQKTKQTAEQEQEPRLSKVKVMNLAVATDILFVEKTQYSSVTVAE